MNCSNNNLLGKQTNKNNKKTICVPFSLLFFPNSPGFTPLFIAAGSCAYYYYRRLLLALILLLYEGLLTHSYVFCLRFLSLMFKGLAYRSSFSPIFSFVYLLIHLADWFSLFAFCNCMLLMQLLVLHSITWKIVIFLFYEGNIVSRETRFKT